MVTNMPFFMSAVTKRLTRSSTSEAARSPRASRRSAVRIIIMTIEAGTPFPETSATANPQASCPTCTKS